MEKRSNSDEFHRLSRVIVFYLVVVMISFSEGNVSQVTHVFSISTFNTLLSYVEKIFILNVIMDVISYYISPLSLLGYSGRR